MIKTIQWFFLCFNRLTPREFNSYGSRRGNDAIMARGTFANIRLFNKFLNKQAPQTIHLPTGETVRPFLLTCLHTSQNFGLQCLVLVTDGCVRRCWKVPTVWSASSSSSRERVWLGQLQRLGSKGPISTGENEISTLVLSAGGGIHYNTPVSCF